MANSTYNLKTISTDLLKINGNCLEFKNTIIQLSNVSMFSTEEIEPDPFPFKSLGWIIAGIICFVLSSDDYFDNGFFVLLGLCSFVIGFILIKNWYNENKDIGNMMTLVIITNSGDSFALVFNSRYFLSEVIDKLRDLVTNSPGTQNFEINIRDNKFTEIRENTFTDNSSAINNYHDNDPNDN